MTTTREATVAFLDLTGFTTLNDVHGDRTAVAVLDQFLANVEDSLVQGVELVKSLGDGVLLTAPDPRTAVRVVVRIVEGFHGQDGMPDLSGGLHHGSVVEHRSDVLGHGVNLASRLADAAPASSLYLTREVADAATAEGLTVEPLGELELRGIADPVDVFALRACPSDGHDAEIDPVCGMRIRPVESAPHVAHAERTMWFCTEDCQKRFVEAPHRYPTSPPGSSR